MSRRPINSVQPATRDEWRNWLADHYAQPDGVWLVLFKKITGKSRLVYVEAVEEALCYGWVDSKGNKLDDERSLLWFAPRRPGSAWAKSNKERVDRLILAGLMMPPGLAKIEAAKADGTWNALDEVEKLAIPADLRSALEGNAPALQNFESFPRSVRRAILEWVQQAKKPETRLKRVEETARLAKDNIRANQWRN